ncbi:MAG TPA: Bax inhibitor-1/YccA family protein [Burkholderiales bacterium]|jgi:modulator of FtsH protease|nr:Bax inhibitor-1/YccA family protein [Burkholderiales bacterium]
MQPEVQVMTQSAQLALAQNRVLRNTYMLLGLSMIPTVIGAIVGLNTNFAFLAQYPIMGPLLMFAVMIGAMFGIAALRNSVWGVVAMLAFTFLMGWWLGPILQYALNLSNGPQLVGMAAGATGLIFFALATYVTTTRKDFSFLGKFLFVGLILLIIGAIANLFFQVPAASLTISAVAVILFAGYMLYDVSAIVHGGETNYIMATLRVYIDIYNMFVHLLNLLLAFAGNRE